MLKGFRCGAPMACKGLVVEVSRSSDRNIFIEKLECNGESACLNADFLLGTGITFQNCVCGTATERSCDGIKGIDTCLAGLERLECTGNDGCYDMREVIRNPSDNFELICGNIRSCELFHLTMNLDTGAMAPIGLFKGFVCSNVQSCKDATITVNNAQSNSKWLFVEVIECSGEASCLNTQFVSNGAVQINDIKCADQSSCVGCTHTHNGECRNCDGSGNSYCAF